MGREPIAKRRILLNDILNEKLGIPVYFQPPPTLVMSYPCLVYRLDSESVDYADNKRYSQKERYLLTLIDRDPDSKYRDLIEELNYCSLNRFYAADNLNHWAFNLYF